MVRLPDVPAVLALHERVLAELGGGSRGILDVRGIEASVGRMTSGVREREFFPDVFDKAAALLESLIRNHGFVDGNKRTAMLATDVLLELNGLHLAYERDEAVELTLGIANRQIDLQEIVIWLRDHSTPA